MTRMGPAVMTEMPDIMAADGSDYRAILAHYYPGTELGKDE